METSERLASISFFQSLPDNERDNLALRFERRFAKLNDVIFRQGDPADAFYIVDSGLLRARGVVQGEEIPRAYFYPGDYFGETGLLTGKPRNATVEVLEDSELLVLSKAHFDLLLERFPEIRQDLLEFGRIREQAGKQRFPWQEEDEATLSVQTKHWVALLRASRSILLLLIPFIALLPVYFSNSLSAWERPAVTLAAGTLLGLASLALVYHFFDWRNDQYIVTNKRVLHIERVFLLREERHEAPISQVQDVVVNKGVLANLFDFGHITIQTAGPTGQIKFAYVSHPGLVQDSILAPKQQTQAHEKAIERRAIRQELEQRLGITEPQPQDGDQPHPSDRLAKAGTQPPAALFNWGETMGRSWQWIKDQISFQTRFVTEGGNTITWRKDIWFLVQASLLPMVTLLILVAIFLFLMFGRVSIFSWRAALIPLALIPTVLVWWFYRYWDWQNDFYQISGNRLIDVHKRPLFLAEDRRETTLDRVENIRSDVPGPIAKILNYGSVIIETAGEVGAFTFDNVHAPIDVHQEIFARLQRYRREQEERERQRRRGEMAEWFEIYDGIKREQGELG